MVEASNARGMVTLHVYVRACIGVMGIKLLELSGVLYGDVCLFHTHTHTHTHTVVLSFARADPSGECLPPPPPPPPPPPLLWLVGCHQVVVSFLSNFTLTCSEHENTSIILHSPLACFPFSLIASDSAPLLTTPASISSLPPPSLPPPSLPPPSPHPPS